MADPATFVAQLLNPDPISRRAFIEREELDGTRLPGPAFQLLLSQLATSEGAPLAGSIEWLRDAVRFLGPEQLLRIDQECQVVYRLLAGAAATPGAPA